MTRQSRRARAEGLSTPYDDAILEISLWTFWSPTASLARTDFVNPSPANVSMFQNDSVASYCFGPIWTNLTSGASCSIRKDSASHLLT